MIEWRQSINMNKNTEKVEMWPGVVKQSMAWGERLMIVVYHIDSGGVVSPHSHEHEQGGFVVKGELECVIGEESSIVKAGESYMIPSGVTHSARVSEPTEVIDVFSPPREDFL